MMGIEPISHAQVGVRQYGVDVAAVGEYNDEGKVLMLFTIKQGDLGRSDWDVNEQSIRQSLDEIKDVYLDSHIRPEHLSLKKKIILCTGGNLKQEIQQNWKGYISKNTKVGEVEYEFWGGDKLSIFIEEFMFNEQIVPIEFRSSFRKVLSLLSDPDYDLSDYYNILNSLLLESEFGSLSKQNNLKKAIKALRSIHLVLNILFFWAKNEENLKPAIYASERTMLVTWEFLRKNDLFNKRSILSVSYEIYKTLLRIYSEYFNKLQQYCHIQNGLNGYSRHSILENLNIFEQLGIICTSGALYIFHAGIEQDEKLLESARAITDTVKSLIENHSSTCSPYYDNHIIEISEAIFLLSCFSEKEFIDNWIKKILNHIAFAYNHMGRYFPIQSDSFDDLVALAISGTKRKEELIEISTLLPIIAQWCAVLELRDSYSLVRDVVENVFQNTTLQIWYPDSETDQFIYICNAAFKSGIVDAPMSIPETIEDMKTMIEKVKKKIVNFEGFSSVKNGFAILPIISSRHFKTPFLPCFWQQGIINKS
ncbi:MAG: hypothetical protein MRK01_11845 [Candidatus Scalindua sp.]|nr:hypothetical protein [Candidatus Scalindua sp.]